MTADRGRGRGFGEWVERRSRFHAEKRNLSDDSARHEEYFLYSQFRLLTEKLVKCGNAQKGIKEPRRGKEWGEVGLEEKGIHLEAISNNASF